MEKISNILKNFNTLSEYTDFLNTLVEAEGSEISRGKDPNDKSKDEKEVEEVPAEGGEEVAPEEGGEEPVVDPVAAPGSQVAIGNKEVDKSADPEAVEIEISGEKDKIDTKPKKNVNPNNM